MGVLWNGNVWTPWWEVLCCLGIALLGAVSLLWPRVVGAVFGALLSALMFTKVDTGLSADLLGPPFVSSYGRFSTLFLADTLMSIWADRIPCSWILALASAVAVAYYQSGSVARGIEHPPGDYLFAAVPLAYLCVWLGIRLPLRRVCARVDLSYGVYIYGCPVQQARRRLRPAQRGPGPVHGGHQRRHLPAGRGQQVRGGVAGAVPLGRRARPGGMRQTATLRDRACQTEGGRARPAPPSPGAVRRAAQAAFRKDG